MNRRGFLIGSAGLTGGLTATLGTGAFSAAQVSGRDANIAISNDANALIGLIPNDEVVGVKHGDAGKLTIDLEEPGINQESIFQFGRFASDSGISGFTDFPYTSQDPLNGGNPGSFDSAFLIVNQTDNTQTLDITYNLTNGFSGDVWFEVHSSSGRVGSLLEPPFSGTVTETFNSGEAYGVSFLLDVPSDTAGESLSGSLSITAGEASGNP